MTAPEGPVLAVGRSPGGRIAMWDEAGRNAAREDDEDALLGAHEPSSPSTAPSFFWGRRAEIAAACVFLCGISAGSSLVASMDVTRAHRERDDLPRLRPEAPAEHAHVRGLLRRDPRAEGAAAPDGRPAAGAARVWQTARDLGRWERQADVRLVGQGSEFQGPVIDISAGQQQTLLGFGGAFTEAAAETYQKLPEDLRKQVIRDYFSEEGLGYTTGRVHINSCDFSVDHYSFDDVEDDFELKHFDENVTHDAEALLPFISAAQEVLQPLGRSLRLLATPWSPPAWMKNNGQMDHSTRPCLRDGASEAWANYISKWLSAYKAQGVPVWAVSVQNEPENDARWEACLWTAEEEAAFLGEQLGPALNRSHPEVLIFGYDHNKDHLVEWADALGDHPTAAAYLDGMAFHWYSGDSFGAVAEVRQRRPKLLLLASEATYEQYRWHEDTNLEHGDWSFGEGYAHDILGDLNAGSIGWIDWNLLLDQDGGPNHSDNPCDAALMVDTREKRVYRHPQFYFIGHFSKYLLPGSKHLRTRVSPEVTYQGDDERDYGTCSGEDGLQATAAQRPDGLVAAVVLNCGDNPVGFQLRHRGQALVSTIPPHAIQTYLFAPGGSEPQEAMG